MPEKNWWSFALLISM